MATKLTTDILGLDNATQAVEFTVGTGDPNGVVTAVTGSIFVDATTPGLYQNDSGGTVWTAVGGAGWPTTVGTDYAGTPYEQALVAAANGDLIISPNGDGALIAQVPDGTVAGGNTRGAYAVDLQRGRFAAGQVASGNYAVTIGGIHNTASGNYAATIGGFNNTASGSGGAVVGGFRGVASNNSVILAGDNNAAYAQYSSVLGGYAGTITGARGSIIGGRSSTVSGPYGFALCGNPGAATGYFSGTMGVAEVSQWGEFGHGAWRFSTAGDAQYSRFVLLQVTTNATPAVLTARGNATSSERMEIENDTAYKFQIDLVAKEANAANAAWWQISGCILRDATAASTILVGTPTVTTDNTGTGTAATWSVAVTADTTNGALAITVTGAAATIRWVAVVHSSKVGAP